MTIYIGFSTSDDLESIAIREMTGGPASHAMIKHFLPEFGIDVILGADAGGWRYQPLSRFLDTGNRIVGLYELRDVDLSVGLQACAQWLGAPYDWAGLLGMAEVEIERKLGLAVHNRLQRAGAWFCSEITRKVVESSRFVSTGQPVSLEMKDAPGETDPNELMRTLAAKSFAIPATIDGGTADNSCLFPKAS